MSNEAHASTPEEGPQRVPKAPAARRREWLRRFFIVLAPALAVSLLLLGPPDLLTGQEWRLVICLVWMVLWWISEAVPVPVTGMLPLILFPMMRIQPEADVAASYAHPLIFLFVGGLFLGAAVERTGLHRRLALAIVSLMGGSAPRLVAGFMLAAAGLSMWISNTAAAVMMFPLVLSVIHVAEQHMDKEDARNLGRALMLGMAWSCSIGGVASLVSSPPTGMLAAYMAQNHDVHLTFLKWLIVGGTYVIFMLPITWAWLSFVSYRLQDLSVDALTEEMRKERAELGPMTSEQRLAGVLFASAAVLWLFRSVIVDVTGLPLSDANIALLVALATFSISVRKPQLPAGRGPLLDWEHGAKINWSVIFIFGGGLAIGNAFHATGLTQTLGALVAQLGPLPLPILATITTGAVSAMTELMSNTATTAAMLPIVDAVATAFDADPVVLLIPIAIIATTSFMLPISTPPNTIVFAWKHLHISDMLRAGVAMNFVALILTVTISLTVARWVFG